MKKFLEEFKGFILKGNVMNLAVGVIIGAAFQGIVTSLTDNILSPIIGLFSGMNFDQLQISAFGVTIKYGAFITSIINFIFMAFVVFMLVKFVTFIMNIGKKPAEKKEPTTRECPYCATEISIKATRCPACTSEIR